MLRSLYIILSMFGHCLHLEYIKCVYQELNRVEELALWHQNFLLNFSTLCIQNVNNTGTKQGSIMK
jgi:hypothetical protein